MLRGLLPGVVPRRCPLLRRSRRTLADLPRNNPRQEAPVKLRAWSIAVVVTLCVFAGLLVSRLRDDGSGKTSPNDVRSVPSTTGSGNDESRPGSRRDGLDRGRQDGPAVEPGIPPGDAELVAVVLDNAGEAIPGVVVVLRSTRSTVGSLGVETTTDGKAVFADIGAGSFALRVRRNGVPDLETVDDIAVGPAERTVVELRVGDFDMSILGRVVTTSGEPLPGIKVEARAAASRDDQPALVPVGQGVLRATTTADGLYRIAGLGENAYEVSTVETEQFPSVHRIVRAGLDPADLVLEATRILRIVGTVTHAVSKQPVAGVLVVPIGFRSRQVKTEGDGRFETMVPLRSTQVVYSVELRLEGYKTGRETLRVDGLDDLVEWQIDATLQELRSTTLLTGVLVGDDGEVLRGETIHVQSARGLVRKKGVSDENGRFTVRGLLPGDDYRVWVYPTGAYRDLRRNGILVPGEGLDLELTFESVGSGSIRGRVVDPEGNPVRNFGLWVATSSAVNKSRRLSTGPRGEFRVEDVPAGTLTFQTRSLPRFTVRGLSLKEGAETETEIVVDWGDGEIISRLVDASGEPIELARVDLHWQQEWGDGNTTSYRSTQTDREGLFRFTQLGRGVHRLRINARGYAGLQLDIDVGSEEPPATVVLQK